MRDFNRVGDEEFWLSFVKLAFQNYFLNYFGQIKGKWKYRTLKTKQKFQEMFITTNQLTKMKGIEEYFLISPHLFRPAICVGYITDSTEKDLKKLSTCLSFYLTLNISEAKIHFPSQCFDFHKSYCLKTWIDTKSPLKKLLVTAQKTRCNWKSCCPSLSVQTCQLLKPSQLRETHLLCNQRQFCHRPSQVNLIK